MKYSECIGLINKYPYNFKDGFVIVWSAANSTYTRIDTLADEEVKVTLSIYDSRYPEDALLHKTHDDAETLGILLKTYLEL